MGRYKIVAGILKKLKETEYPKRIRLFSGIFLFGVVGYFLVWLAFFIEGYIPTGDDLNKADWLAFLGEYLSAFGTIVLGVVAYLQNRNLNKINSELMMLQKSELAPLIRVLDFCGEIEQNPELGAEAASQELIRYVIPQSETESNENRFGYGFVHRIHDEVSYAISYKMTFQFSGKVPAHNVVIRHISFVNNIEGQAHSTLHITINKNIPQSLFDNTRFDFIFKVTNEYDPRIKDSQLYQILCADHMEISFELSSEAYGKYDEKIRISKTYIEDLNTFKNTANLNKDIFISDEYCINHISNSRT